MSHPSLLVGSLQDAIVCAVHRLPGAGRVSPRAYVHAVGLRFGLVGLAALIHRQRDVGDIRAFDRTLHDEWPLMVVDAMNGIGFERVPFARRWVSPLEVALLSQDAVNLGFALAGRGFGIDILLQAATMDFTRNHETEMFRDVAVLARPPHLRAWRALETESVRYARSFFLRQRAAIHEVAEIAILGE